MEPVRAARGEGAKGSGGVISSKREEKGHKNLLIFTFISEIYKKGIIKGRRCELNHLLHWWAVQAGSLFVSQEKSHQRCHPGA